MFRFGFLLGPAPFFVASLFCFVAKRKSGWGICGSFLVAFFVLFCLFLVMICQSFWTTCVLYFTASHRLRNCKDRA